MSDLDSMAAADAGRDDSWWRSPQLLFVVLALLALIRPFGRGDLYLPLSLAVVGAVVALFLLARRVELIELGRWLRDRWPMVLLGWLVVGVTLSMAVSVQRVGVGEWRTLITFVYSKYAVLALLPLLVALFARRLVAAPWGVFFALFLLQMVGFAAYLHVDWAADLFSWSRGADWIHPEKRLAGLFDNPTVYGAISALFVLFMPAWYWVFGRRVGGVLPLLFTVLVTLVCLVGVFVSHSLTALIAVFGGGVAWLLNGTLRWRHALVGVAAFVVGFHLMGVFSGYFAERMSRTLPYFEELHERRLPTWERLQPKLRYDNHSKPFYWSTHGRWTAWKRAMTLWSERPFTGIGLGQFRLLSGIEARDENPHNLYIQVLAENGLISFVPFALLVLYLGWRVLATPWFGLFGGVAVMHMGNNFFDYSLPWVICIAWAGAYFVYKGERSADGPRAGGGQIAESDERPALPRRGEAAAREVMSVE